MESSEILGRVGNPTFGGTLPPPPREARTTKKARFRDEDHAGIHSAQVSYKETLVNATQAMEQGVGGGTEDWDFEEGDVIETNEGNMPSIKFSARVHAKLSEPWKNSVVVKLLGRPLGYRALCTRLNVMWKSVMGFSVIDLENNYYLVRFRSVEDAMNALTKGPWLIMGHYLTVQPLTPSFDFTNTVLDQVTVWIRLPSLAVHLYDRKILQKLGQLVGTVIKINSTTTSSTCGRFARLAVSISLTRPLVSQFELDVKIQKVEYEGLPIICYKCGRYGHSSNNRKEVEILTNSENTDQPQQTKPGDEFSGQKEDGSKDDSHVEPFGPWMIATKRGWKPKIGKENTSDLNRNMESAGAGISRFQILAQVSEEDENQGHADCTDFLSTSRQPFRPVSNLTFTSNTGNIAKTLARRKLQNKAVAASPQSRKQNAPKTSTVNPFQPSAFNTNKEDRIPLPHANQNFKPHTFPQQASSNRLVLPFETTLDPAKHAVVFCSSQTLHKGDAREAATGHMERQGPDPQHLAETPDDQNNLQVPDGGNAHTSPAVPMVGDDGDGMTDDEDSMVQETPLALMEDVTRQQ